MDARVKPGHDGRRSRDAALEPLFDRLVRQVAADEHDAAGAPLVILPGALMVAIQDHVHALEHETLRIVLEGENTLAAQNTGALLLHQILHPWEELVGIERLLRRQRDRLHLLIVVVLEAAALMGVIVVVPAIVIMLMLMIMVVPGFEKFRLNVEDAIEIESVASENLI